MTFSRDRYRGFHCLMIAAAALSVSLSKANAEPQPSQKATVNVAIVGAIVGEPAVYELPNGATIGDAVERVEGLSPSATGTFWLFRGTSFRAQIQVSQMSMELRDGDAITALDHAQPVGPDRTIVLISQHGRPLVARLPATVISRDALRVKLGLRRDAPIDIIPSGSSPQSTLPNGVFVIADAIDAGYWHALASTLTVRPYVETAGFETTGDVQVADRGSDLHMRLPQPRIEITDVAPAPVPSEIAIQEPTSVQLPTSVVPLPMTTTPESVASLPAVPEPTTAEPILRAPTLDETPFVAATPTVPVPVDVPRSEETVTEIVSEPFVISQNDASLTISGDVSVIESPVDVTIETLAASPSHVEPRALVEPLDVAQPIPVSTESPATPSTTPAWDGSQSESVGLIALALGVVLLVGGGYLIRQTPEPEFAVEESMQAEADVAVDRLTIIQEEPEVDLPLSITGRAVALGKLRIDDAHEQVSGPHFAIGEQQGRSNRPRQTRVSYESGDLLGRALAAMDQERS